MAYENMNYSYDAGIAPGVVDYHERTLLRNVMPDLIWAKDMQMRPLPLNNGKRVQFRRMIPFAASTKPLEEGVTKKGQKLRMTDLWVTIKPYGEHIEYTDELDLTHIDNLHREMNTLLSNQAKLSIDALAREAKCSGTNVLYAGGRASRAAVTAADVLTYNDIKKAVRALDNNNAKRFADGFYHANIDPDTRFDLTADPKWVDVATYQDKRKIETGELGCMAGVKFFETTEGKHYETEAYLALPSVNSAVSDAITSLSVVSYNADKLTVVVDEELTEYACRMLAGKMVTLGSELAYIEYAEAATSTIKLRWEPATAPTSSTTITPAAAGASGVSLRATVVYGQDFAGGVSLAGNGHNVRIIIKPLGSSGSDDPYDQRGTIAYKIKGLAYTILQDSFGVRIEHAVSA